LLSPFDRLPSPCPYSSFPPPRGRCRQDDLIVVDGSELHIGLSTTYQCSVELPSHPYRRALSASGDGTALSKRSTTTKQT
jgi:hypothetical protein